jgi:hypothetical protein
MEEGVETARASCELLHANFEFMTHRTHSM